MKNSFRFFIISAFLLFGKIVIGQNQYVFGDSLTNEKGVVSHQLSDGTIWVVGSTVSGTGINMDVVAVRIDTGGNILSEFYKYGTLDLEYPNNMVYQNGKLIIAGEQHTANGVDGFILVIDTLGNQVSFQNYGQLNTSEQFFDIELTQDGGFVVSGFSSIGPGNDFLIGKFDSQHQLEWLRTHDLGTNDIGVTVLENPNGGYLIAGDQLQPLGVFNVVVLSVDALGNALWNTVISGPFNGGCKSMVNLGDDVLIVGEMSTSTSSSFDIYLAKMDWQGNLKWQKNIPKTDNGDACFDAFVNNFNEVVLTGYVYSTTTNTTDMFVMIVDSVGDIINEEYYHNTTFEMGYDVKPNMYGGFITTGFTSNLSTGVDQFLVAFPNIGISTSVTEKNLNKLEVSLYPNPTKNKVFLSQSIEYYDLKVFSLQGQECRFKRVEDHVEIKELQNGLYHFVFTNVKGEVVFFQKILKE
jgi:hypothetical protein